MNVEKTRDQQLLPQFTNLLYSLYMLNLLLTQWRHMAT